MPSGSSVTKSKTASSKPKASVPLENLGELLRQLGDIPPERVRLNPSPGQATKKDLLRLLDRDNILCELVDDTLVEKAVGQVESLLAGWLIHCLWSFLETRDLGRVFGADAPFELRPRLIRLPDVAFVSHQRLPQGDGRRKPVATWVPELAVEIVSKGNSKREIERKLSEYFDAGVVLVWIVDPRKKSVKVYRDINTFETLGERDRLSGGSVLPGFSMSIREWFAKIE